MWRCHENAVTQEMRVVGAPSRPSCAPHSPPCRTNLLQGSPKPCFRTRQLAPAQRRCSWWRRRRRTTSLRSPPPSLWASAHEPALATMQQFEGESKPFASSIKLEWGDKTDPRPAGGGREAADWLKSSRELTLQRVTVDRWRSW